MGNILMPQKHQMFKRTARLTADTVVLSTSTNWMRKCYISTLMFTFTLTHNLTFTVSDGGYESDDERIWSEEDEKTTEDIHNYGEHLNLFEEVVYTYVEDKTLKNNYLAIICHSTNELV